MAEDLGDGGEWGEWTYFKVPFVVFLHRKRYN